MKRLMLMRHAKSSWGDENLPDFERTLNGRGERDAQTIGRMLKEKHAVPDVIVSSSAVRAVETTKRAMAEFGREVPVHFEDGLYGASPDRILEQVRRLPDQYDSALIVGHNPGMTDLVTALTREYPPEGMKTANVACISLNSSPPRIGGPRGRWKDAAAGKLEWILTPRDDDSD